MAYLLDTNVVSEAAKRRANPHVTAWFDTVSPANLHLSVMVVGEIRRGVEKLARRGDVSRADQLDRWLTSLRSDFADRIVPVTLDIAEEWGRLTARHGLPLVDAVLAATAATHKWTIVTRNVTDFDRTGIPVVNPFDAT